MNHSTGKPTKYEQERIDALLRLGCPACAHLGIPNATDIEVHHLLDGGVRLGHWFTLGLCTGHHRGIWSPEQLAIFTAGQLVAISDGRKAFTSVYPSEREMWERVQERLHLPAVWPVSKRVARAV